MSNRAYASVWVREFSEESLIENWGSFLGTVPFSAKMPGFSNLVIRALDETETPIIEQDLRSVAADANTLLELALNHVHSDCSYGTEARWDMWVYHMANLRWELQPQPLGIYCYGEEFGDCEWRENGHFLVDAGFEHLFTGHSGLLGSDKLDRGALSHPEEQRFVLLMSHPQNLSVYREKTRENIRKLYEWMRKVEAAVPVDHTILWSEGEENFGASIEEILADR